MSEFDIYDLPFSSENAELLSGGSRSLGYRVNGWIMRIPTKEDFLIEQKREADISELLHKELPENLRNKVTYTHFNGKCSFHREIIGDTLQKVYKDMSVKQRKDLAMDIAELLHAIHNIPFSEVNKAVSKYSKICRNENKTTLSDFNYHIAREQLLDCSLNKLDLNTFETKIPKSDWMGGLVYITKKHLKRCFYKMVLNARMELPYDDANKMIFVDNVGGQ